MTKSQDRDKKSAKLKGALAAGAAVGTGALVVLGLPWWLIAGGAAGTGYLAYKWFRFRAKRGMRF